MNGHAYSLMHLSVPYLILLRALLDNDEVRVPHMGEPQ
jgi:hypothetical protein